jgi:hypothetical protein
MRFRAKKNSLDVFIQNVRFGEFPQHKGRTVLKELYTGQLPEGIMEKTITFSAPTEPGEYKLHLNFVADYNPPGDYCDGNIVETTLIVEPEIRISDYQPRVIKGQINLFNVTIGNLGRFREEYLTVELKEGTKILDNATLEHIDSNEYKPVIVKWETENAALGFHDITIVVLGEDKGSLTDLTAKVSVLAPSKAKTLIVTNLDRLDGVENDLILLSHHPSVNAIILNVANDQNCSEAYNSWDSNPTSENANDVARAIKKLIDSSLKVYENIEYIIIAGNDEVIPFYRIQDKSLESYVGSYGLYDEKDYIERYEQLKRTTAIGSAFQDNMFLTDDFYANVETEDLPEGFLGELYIPEKPIGRLVETPEEISKTIDVFSKKGDIVNPNRIFIKIDTEP